MNHRMRTDPVDALWICLLMALIVLVPVAIAIAIDH